MFDDATDDALALYVHWPFCKAKCPYCDFNSHVRTGVDQARWAKALVAELGAWTERVERRPLASIFFGGGTPSLMAPATVASVIDAASASFGLTDAVEITLEANPTSVEADKFRGFRAAGVNRVSLGVQALDDADLRRLGREHSAAEALAALDLASTIFPRWTFDLIYARPGQTLATWEQELARALTLVGSHLSLYQLTIEPGTRFRAEHEAGRLVLPPEEEQAQLYEATSATLACAGLPAYEISNHARPGEESRHNLVYWRYGEYLGIGPGAHGRVGLAATRRHATRAYRAPERWLEAVERCGHGLEEELELSPEEQMHEALLMGLRLREGLPLARLERLGGKPWSALLSPLAVERHIGSGLLTLADDRLTATAAGRQRLDWLLPRLLA